MSTGPIWARLEPGERRATLTREQITRTAIELADREGPKAISMRRIAQELGVGTMTLYGYVKTKDELLELMDDMLMGDLLVPEDEFPDGDWRAALEAISDRSRASFDDHPWVLEAMGSLGNQIGPNGIKHFDQTLRAVRDLRLTAVEKLDLTSLVDEYVFGFALRQTADMGPDDAEWEDIKTYVDRQLDTGDYPYIAEVFPAGEDRAAAWAAFAAMTKEEDQRFRRGLARLLDGIEADLKRRGAL